MSCPRARLVSIQVERQVAHDERVVRLARPPAEGAHARQQLLERERLGQVVVGARVESADPIGHRVARGQHQDRDARRWRRSSRATARPSISGSITSSTSRSYGVASAAQAVEAVVRDVDAVAGLDQGALHDAGNAGIVFYKQDAHDNASIYRASLESAWTGCSPVNRFLTIG